MNVIRMIKLFGWEPYTLEQVQKARNNELGYMKKVRLMQAGMLSANDAISIIAKLVVFSVYVRMFGFRAGSWVVDGRV